MIKLRVATYSHNVKKSEITNSKNFLYNCRIYHHRNECVIFIYWDIISLNWVNSTKILYEQLCYLVDQVHTWCAGEMRLISAYILYILIMNIDLCYNYVPFIYVGTYSIKGSSDPKFTFFSTHTNCFSLHIQKEIDLL